MGTPRACLSSAGSFLAFTPPSHDRLTTPNASLLQALADDARPDASCNPPYRARDHSASSGWVDDLAPPVGAAGRAGHVRELRLVTLRAAHQRRRGGLPVRTSRSGVTAGHPPLGNRHVSPPVGRWRRRAGPDGCLRCQAATGRPTGGRSPRRAGDQDPRRRAARRTRRTARDSPPGTAVTSAVRALPRHGKRVPDRAGHR